MKTLFPGQEKIGRFCGLFVFIFMIALQFYYLLQMQQKENTALIDYVRWSLVTLLFILFFIAYVIRKPAKDLANNFTDIILPAISAALPFFILLGPRYLHLALKSDHFSEYKDIISPIIDHSLIPVDYLAYRNYGLIVMAIGEIITIWGMLYLRSSFSIFTEVRDFISHGIYRFVRHPLYLGEILSVWGFTFFIPVWWTLIGAILFTIIQSYRAKREERKISLHFPQYLEYKKQAGFLWPKFF